VVTPADQEEVVFDVSTVTAHPIAVELVGPRAFVVGEDADGHQVAALFEPGASGKPARVVYRLGPATTITAITRDGKRRVAVHRHISQSAGTREETALVALETGKTIASGHGLSFKPQRADAAEGLDFRVNSWADGMTHAIGIKGGEWDPKENQRTPDIEATYDLIAGKFTTLQPIKDLFEQHKRYQTLAEFSGRTDFVCMTWDNTAVQAWRASQPTQLELDQPVASYDPKSLQGSIDPDGSASFALQIDPVNPDAVGRQKTDPEYLDVFRTAADGKAIRQARVLATGKHFRFGAIDRDRFWLLEKSKGSDRGGMSLVVYRAGAAAAP
jgi:hypothetical protein